MSAALVAVSIWTPVRHPAIFARWFDAENLPWFAPVPLLAIAALWLLARAVRQHQHLMPFACTLGLVFLGYTGLGISIWPEIIPSSATIWEAAAPPQSHGFALVGALLILPVILMYTAWSYYVFRGKVRHGDGYH
jgi:cytochrome d ubiquinol oxidase subunit II